MGDAKSVTNQVESSTCSQTVQTASRVNARTISRKDGDESGLSGNDVIASALDICHGRLRHIGRGVEERLTKKWFTAYLNRVTLC